MKEAWIYGCGKCGRDIYLKADLSIESRPSDSQYLPDPADEPCEHCRKVIDTGQDLMGSGNLILECLCYLMNWCKCGNPEDMTAAVMQYLEITGSDKRFDHQENDEARRTLWYLLAYISDGLEWTEHGGSVGGAWLTDTGKEALRKYMEVIDD